MKEELFEKVVEKELYNWQKGDMNLSHLIFFLEGILTLSMFIGIFTHRDHLFWVSILGLAIIFVLCIRLKRKVYYRRLK